MSGLSEARLALADALESIGERVASPGEAWTPPCIRLHPGNPWLGPSTLAAGQRTQRWEVWYVVGKAAGKHNYNQIEERVSRITNALDLASGWSGIVWDRPNPTDMGGTQYLAVRGTIETRKGV